jgi:hypothetical protein
MTPLCLLCLNLPDNPGVAADQVDDPARGGHHQIVYDGRDAKAYAAKILPAYGDDNPGGRGLVTLRHFEGYPLGHTTPDPLVHGIFSLALAMLDKY